MYKMITCDLDETLLSSDITVCKRNRDAIAKASQIGVKFVPATGRGYNAIKSTLKELNLFDQPDQYVISFNGGCITENKNSRILKFTSLPFTKAEELFQLGRQYDVCIHVYTKERVYLFNADQNETDYMTARHPCKIMNDQKNLAFLEGQEIAKVIYGKRDMRYLKEIATQLATKTTQLDVSYSSNRFLEFNPAGVNKGAGLLWLAKKLGIKPEETMALGDNFNDLSMIKAAGLGVGMQNTAAEMKNECDVITKADNNAGGVGEAIERFILTPAKN